MADSLQQQQLTFVHNLSRELSGNYNRGDTFLEENFGQSLHEELGTAMPAVEYAEALELLCQ